MDIAPRRNLSGRNGPEIKCASILQLSRRWSVRRNTVFDRMHDFLALSPQDCLLIARRIVLPIRSAFTRPARQTRTVLCVALNPSRAHLRSLLLWSGPKILTGRHSKRHVVGKARNVHYRAGCSRILRRHPRHGRRTMCLISSGSEPHDPVGTPPNVGHEAIRAFFTRIFSGFQTRDIEWPAAKTLSTSTATPPPRRYDGPATGSPTPANPPAFEGL